MCVREGMCRRESVRERGCVCVREREESGFEGDSDRMKGCVCVRERDNISAHLVNLFD